MTEKYQTSQTELQEIKRFKFDNTFKRELDGFFVPWKAEKVSDPNLLEVNNHLAYQLGLDADKLRTKEAVNIFAGNLVPFGAAPLAQVYAGHQFGGVSPQLGDGRALLLGEVIHVDQKRWDIQLKGSGKTPFSRGGDGKAALGPVLREYIIGEAMFVLGIPTTRALAAVTTGDYVQRETALPGAVLTRVAASHIRVGTFQYFAARGEKEKVKQLTDYAIQRHYPQCALEENRYLSFFKCVMNAQAYLVSRWMSVGFIHGVMNTDNMTISGETIDYGPCAFMDAYEPSTVFSSIDTHGRYAYQNQPLIAEWNLTRFAETLVPIVTSETEHSVAMLTEALDEFSTIFENFWLTEMRKKLGLNKPEANDKILIEELLSIMHKAEVDFTMVFRNLSKSLEGNKVPLCSQFNNLTAFDKWFERWQIRLKREGIDEKKQAIHLNLVNPIYIPRNHLVERALKSAVNDGDMTKFSKLLKLLASPYEEVDGMEQFADPAPPGSSPYRTFCGT